MQENGTDMQGPTVRRGRPSRGGSLWGDLLPEVYGIAFAAVLLLGVIGAAASGLLALGQQQRLAQAAQRARLVEVVAAALTDADVAKGTELLERQVVAAGATSACWLGPDGKVLTEWPRRPGVAAPPPSGLPGTVAYGAPVGDDAGALRMIFPDRDVALGSAVILSGSALVAAVVFVVFLMVYRRLRRQLRPMAAVQHSLRAMAEGVEQELLALTLSDSLGQVADGWNRLVRELQQLRTLPATRDTDRAGSALQRFETRTLRRMLDRLPLGVFCVDRNQHVTYANAAAGRLLADPTDGELCGRVLTDVLSEEDSAPLLGAQARGVSGISFDRERGEGEAQVTLRFRVFPVSELAGGGETLVTVEDVSHLQEAERARDNFLYHVTHELRTPLTNIQAYAETLTKPAFDDEQTRRECYNVIISETRRLSRLVENILSISQLEVGSARIELGDVDFVRLLRQTVQDNLGAADEKSIELTLKLPPKVPKIRGDKQRLSVLLNNLIGNAIKYTPEDGKVGVSLDLLDRQLQIAVEDTGIGIDPADQGHVFEKFYRAASEQVQTITGTGLGLAIAREVARLHGGDIRLHSQPGKGSTFIVELPGPADEL